MSEESGLRVSERCLQQAAMRLCALAWEMRLAVTLCLSLSLSLRVIRLSASYKSDSRSIRVESERDAPSRPRERQNWGKIVPAHRRNILENKNIKIDLPDSGPHLGLVSVATTAAYEWIVQRELVKTIQSLKRGCPRIDCEAEIHYLHEPLLCPPKCCFPAGFRRGHRTEKEPVRL